MLEPLESKARARFSQCFVTKGRENSGRAGVPGIGNDDDEDPFALVQVAKS